MQFARGNTTSGFKEKNNDPSSHVLMTKLQTVIDECMLALQISTWELWRQHLGVVVVWCMHARTTRAEVLFITILQVSIIIMVSIIQHARGFCICRIAWMCLTNAPVSSHVHAMTTFTFFTPDYRTMHLLLSEPSFLFFKLQTQLTLCKFFLQCSIILDVRISSPSLESFLPIRHRD